MSYKLPGLVIRPGVSRYQYLYLVTVNLFAIAGLLLSPLERFPFLILSGLMLLYAVYLHQRYLKPDAGRISEMKIDPSGDIRMQFSSGRRLRGKISERSLITPWMIILQIDLTGHRRRMILPVWNDMLAVEELRQLRVLLRLSHLSCGR